MVVQTYAPYSLMHLDALFGGNLHMLWMSSCFIVLAALGLRAVQHDLALAVSR